MSSNPMTGQANRFQHCLHQTGCLQRYSVNVTPFKYVTYLARFPPV